jgi:hypothetical protein
MRALALLGLLGGASVLLACPPDNKSAPARSSPKACEKVGQTCEFSTGKLGTCVQKDDCATGTCFNCQSQH